MFIVGDPVISGNFEISIMKIKINKFNAINCSLILPQFPDIDTFSFFKCLQIVKLNVLEKYLVIFCNMMKFPH